MIIISVRLSYSSIGDMLGIPSFDSSPEKQSFSAVHPHKILLRNPNTLLKKKKEARKLNRPRPEKPE